MKRRLLAIAFSLLLSVGVLADGGGPEQPPSPCPKGTACATVEPESEPTEPVTEFVASVVASFIGNLF